MKRNIISLTCLFGILSLCLFSCKDEYYTIDDGFYKDKKVTLRNPMDGNTLRIEQYNTDKIILIEPDHPDIVFDNRGFLFSVADKSIVTIQDDGTINPVENGVTKVDVTFRSDERLSTSFDLEVYKDYHAVERIIVPSMIKNTLIERDLEMDIATGILVFPGHADNKKLHFTFADEASEAFASISNEGVITGKAPGIIQVHIVSDDNPQVTSTFEMTVVNEILITDVTLHPNLDNVTIGVGEKINLNGATGILPSTVHILNRRLTFELLEGMNVVEIDPETNLLTAIGAGTAQVKVTSKNDISKEFTVNVVSDLTDLTRAFWTVKSTIVYSNGQDFVVDGTTGMPQDMFIDNGSTFLGLTKPGKNYNNCATPAGYELGFIIDMQLSCSFNTMRWGHRTSNSYVYLRVWAVDLYGSNDGENWALFATGIRIPNTYEVSAENPNAAIADNVYHSIALPGSFDCRYVKVIYTNWSDNSGGSTSGSTLQVARFGLSLL